MNHYIRVYTQLLKLNASKIMIYRGSFYQNIFVSFLYLIFSFASILLLTSRSIEINGWARHELLILTAMYSVVVGIVHVLFTRNFEQLSRIVHRGLLDSVLTKPIDAQFLISVSTINFAAIPRVLAAIGILLYLLNTHGIALDPLTLIKGGFVIGVSIITLYSMWFGILSLTVWQSHLFNLSDLLLHTTDSAKYPSSMYAEFKYFVTIFLLPISLIVTLPTKAVLSRLTSIEFIWLLSFCLLSLLLSRWVWVFVLRFYTSASS